MATKHRWPVILLVYVFPFVLVFVLAYSLVSAPFTPPDDHAPPPVVRSFPLAERLAPPAVLDDANPSSETSQPEGDSAWVAALVADFQARHPADLGGAAHWVDLGEGKQWVPETVRRDFFCIAYLVLKKEESHETLLALVSDRDASVRVEAMKALDRAQGQLMQDGHPALLALWRKLDERQIDAVVAAATETIVHETEQGDLSGIPWLLATLGDYALPAVPHLVWVSDHHPEPDMRTWTSNMAMLIDPASPTVSDLLQRRLIDPNPWVRLNALQAISVRAAAALAGIEHMGPPTASSEAALKST
jgi:hypothetical protein